MKAETQEKCYMAADFSSDQPDIGQRMRALRDKRKWTQEDMAKALGVSKSYVTQIETGTKHPGPKILRVIEMMEASPLSAARGDIMRDVELVGLRYIPVVSWAHAGESVAFEELPATWQAQIPSDAKDPKAFAIEVRGDSMEPHIRDGDRVVLLPSQEPRNGDIVVVKFKNDGIALKLFHETRDGLTINLSSFNPIYPPRDYAPEDFEKIVPVQLVVKTVRY